jgi:DNA-binding response OmpR family regulator
MNNIKVLLVEDEETLAMIIQDTLSQEGFEVCIANDGLEGLSMIAQLSPDVIVADIMMPKMDGFEMVRRVRRSNIKTPVLFLTARSAVRDVVEGFEIGGDDYLRKPFSMLELIVRIRSLVQRFGNVSAPASDCSKIKIGLYTLNTVSQVLSYCDDDGEELSHRESELLKYLAEHCNKVVKTTDILIMFWGDDSPYNARSLQVFITKLRHKLSKDEEIKILNVRGIGYKLIK